jgi:hypothetical protein
MSAAFKQRVDERSRTHARVNLKKITLVGLSSAGRAAECGNASGYEQILAKSLLATVELEGCGRRDRARRLNHALVGHEAIALHLLEELHVLVDGDERVGCGQARRGHSRHADAREGRITAAEEARDLGDACTSRAAPRRPT